jgi:heme-binding HmuY-like protein
MLRASALYCIALSCAGCAEDLKAEGAGEENETVATESVGENVFSTRIDASNDAAWVYFSFAAAGQVTPTDAATSAEWDLGFQRFHVVSNGGASGGGGVAVATLADQTFDGVLTAPADGYVADEPDSDDSDTVANSAFEQGDGWYDYDEATNRLSPRPIVYVVRTARGADYKLSFLDYYDAAGSSGHPSFSWSEL